MDLDMKKMAQKKPEEIRKMIRNGRWNKPTGGLALGYAQANLAILPSKYAFDFILFCQRNPKPCPLLEVLEPGQYETRFMAHGADIRTDIPKYSVYRKGNLEETLQDIRGLWREDFVTFLMGCSFSFEEALQRAKIPMRYVEENKNIPMFISNIPCQPAGIFHGPMVVSMRPIPENKVVRATQITSRFASVHGAPIHIGDPSKIGIKDIRKPDFGEAVTIKSGEVPVFWACGVTPQTVVMNAKPDICIAHAPGHMFVGDLLNEELATL